MSFIKKISSLILSVLIFSVAIVSSAQGLATPATAEPVNCFDYYKFQSVQVSLHPDKQDYKPGEQVIFSGTITNENDYPIIDGYLFVRVVNRNATDPAYFQVIDEFFAASDIKLDTKEEKQVSYTYIVPSNAGGVVSFDYFFSVGKRFNLGGLPFSNEVTISSAKINVANEIKGVSFDRVSTMVNGEKYNHIGSWPVVSKNSLINIKQPIVNLNSDSEKVKVSYDLFYWDSLNEADLINSKTEEINFTSQESRDLTFDIPDARDAVYYLRITALAEDGSKSIVNIRISVDDSRFRINYPAITAFPIKSGDSFNLFSCFHNVSDLNVSNGRVLVSLEDSFGKIIDSTEYTGPIDGNMMAISKEIIAKRDLRDVTVKASIYDENNKLVDSYSGHYTCDGLNSDKCALTQTESLFADTNFIIVFVVFILILLSLLHPSIRKGRVKSIAGLFLVILFIILLVMFWQAQLLSVNAQTPPSFFPIQTMTTSRTYVLYARKPDASDFALIASAGNVQATVSVAMQSVNGQFNVGNTINFLTTPGDIIFNNSSGIWDTPYGIWCNTVDCTNAEFDSYTSASYIQPLWTTLGNRGRGTLKWGATQRPSITFTSSNSSVVSCPVGGTACLANSPGQATITATMAPLMTKYWANAYLGDGRYYTFTETNTINPPLGTGAVTDVGDPYPTKYTLSTYANGRHHLLPERSVSWPVVVVASDTPDGDPTDPGTGTSVNGGWSTVICPTDCGFSTTTYTRTCTNPVPANGGDPCDGSAEYVCPATEPCPPDGFDSALNCIIPTKPAEIVNINTNTTWIASSTSLDLANSDYTKTWRVTDANGTTTTTGTDIFNKIFTTVGLKTVGLTVSTSEAFGNECIATTTVVLQGGGVGEL